MKKGLILLVVTLVMMSHASSFEGLWYTNNAESIVHIRKNGETFEGKIVWLKKPLDAAGNPHRDALNPDKKQRHRKIQNLTILKNFQLSKGMLKKGKIYDPESGNTYSCTMKIINNCLEVHGYIGVALLGRTEKWKRCPQIPTAKN